MSQIRLTKFVSDWREAPPGQIQQGYVLEVVADSPDMDPAVFVYQLGDERIGDRFQCVASVFQMEELPVEKVDPAQAGQQVPYYRSASVKLLCRSAAEVDAYWTQLSDEVDALVQNYNLTLVTLAQQSVTYTGDTTNMTSYEGTAPVRIQLSYRPAGTASFANDVQDIAVADANAAGWLPVSLAPASWARPNGAKFYYNIGRDTLASYWPPQPPFSSVSMYRNGLLMPYGVVYTVTEKTVWWLDFDPTLVPGYARALDQSQDGNAPWPVDYVSGASPGTPTNLVLQFFR